MNFEQVLLLPMVLNPMMERNLINPGSIVEKNLCCYRSLLQASLA